MVTAQVFGDVSLRVDRRSLHLSAGLRQLVATLVAVGPTDIGQDELAEHLWNDQPPPSWKSSLRTRVSTINARAGRTIIASSGPKVRKLDLTADEVDAWDLVDRASSGREITASLLEGAPYRGVELSPVVRGGIDRVVAARQNVLTRWCDHGRVLLPAELASVRAMVERDPFAPSIPELAVKLHALAADRSGAERLSWLLEEAELPLAVDLDALFSASISERRRITLADSRDRIAVEPNRPPVLAASLTDAVSEPLVGHLTLTDELAELAQRGRSHRLLLTGESGVGKSRLAAEVAIRLFDVGYDCHHLVGSQHPGVVLQPFVERLPGLAEVVELFLGGDLDDPSTRTNCWIAVDTFFKKAVATRPVCLVVDDVQWFDAHSAALLQFLLRSQDPVSLAVIVTGRSADESTWEELSQELELSGLMTVGVPPLLKEELVPSLRDRYPEAGSVQLALTSERLHKLSGGLPGVALELMHRMARIDSVLEPHSGHDRGYRLIVRSLPEVVKAVGFGAAVLGFEFSAEDLSAILDSEVDDVFDLLDELALQRLVVESSQLGHWRFAHLLLREAFESLIGPIRLKRLHSRAFEQASDVRRKAEHASLSGHLPESDLAELMLLSAGKHFIAGSYHRAAGDIASAALLAPRLVTIDHQILRLEALERSGAPATNERERIVDDALAAGRANDALRAAITGLPETECLSGDLQRVDLITRIKPEDLTTEMRIERAAHLSRQLLLVGQTATAGDVARSAFFEALTPAKRAATWLAIRHADGWNPVTADELPMDWKHQLPDERLLAHVEEAGLIAGLAAGMTVSTLDGIEAHLADARRVGDPLVLWHALVLQATAAMLLGERDRSSELSSEAYRIGVRFGLASAVSAYYAQTFFPLWVEQVEGEAVTMLDAAPVDTTDNILFRAAHASALHRSNDQARSTKVLAQVVKESAVSRFGTAALGVVAELLRTADREARDYAQARIAAYQGTNLIVGAGLVDLGPSSRSMATCEPNLGRARELYRMAIDQADQTICRLWQVRTRIELAAIEDGDVAHKLRKEAVERANNSWLQAIAKLEFSSPLD